MKKLLFILSAFFIFCAHIFAFEAERIISFDSKMMANTDGSALITETIEINADHRQIRRGIYRDIPRSGIGQIKPQSLFMDGKQHPFFTENQGNYLRINFGNDDYISKGRHTYKLAYSVERALNKVVIAGRVSGPVP
ncbi:MAG: DUF2207 domain-containing protein [Endomicrobium sp.]|jgi:hypothetical protein|nr:DUF2207 domain-containing protein [Endomicrobium sp.]